MTGEASRLRVVYGNGTPVDALLSDYLTRYVNPTTAYRAELMVRQLLRETGRVHPALLTVPDLRRWIAAPPANNSVRQRLSNVRTFIAWTNSQGITDLPLTDLDHLKKQFPKTYGKVQAPHPGRWLSHDEAFNLLIKACQDGTWPGSRDQIIVRLGLLGLRVDEIRRLTWGAPQPDGTLRWMGKGRRQRSARPGSTLSDLLNRWRSQTERQLGRSVTAHDPVICRRTKGGNRRTDELAYGQGYDRCDAIAQTVRHRAAMAGLGHVSPHDLRRSAAGILHNSLTPDGGHRFDLLDIQKVLDHADPATTQRSYIAPIDNRAKTLAGSTLD